MRAKRASGSTNRPGGVCEPLPVESCPRAPDDPLGSPHVDGRRRPARLVLLRGPGERLHVGTKDRAGSLNASSPRPACAETGSGKAALCIMARAELYSRPPVSENDLLRGRDI